MQQKCADVRLPASNSAASKWEESPLNVAQPR